MCLVVPVDCEIEGFLEGCKRSVHEESDHVSRHLQSIYTVGFSASKISLSCCSPSYFPSPARTEVRNRGGGVHGWLGRVRCVAAVLSPSSCDLPQKARVDAV